MWRVSDIDLVRGEREYMHRRAQKAEGELLKAQAEIARLTAEVERLTEELTASCARAELQQREAERLRRNNGSLHDTIEKIFEEGAKNLARADTAHNDAIEAAAQIAGKPFLPLDIGGDLICDPSQSEVIAEAIRALRRPTQGDRE